MKEKFISKDFDEDTLNTIRWVNDALDEYSSKGYTVSVRQLFYYGLTRNYYSNTKAAYNRLGSIITDARMAGWLDWSAVEDRNRVTMRPYFFRDPNSCLQAAIDSFKVDKWAEQPHYVEVVVEKAALEGVIGPVCSRFDVPSTSLRGYGSVTLMYDMGKRLQERFVQGGKQIHVIALADHDPSGLDITRDLYDRLSLFSGCPVNVHRIALNMDQITQFRLPENPLKASDPRSNAYFSKYGASSWELDAIPVETLADWVTKAILMLRDEKKWSVSQEKEDQLKDDMQDLL